MLGLGASTLIALSLWIATIAAYRTHARSRGRADEADEGVKWPSAASGTVPILVLIVCAVAGGSAWLEAKRDRPTHDADIAAVRFVDGKARAFSIDVDGVLKVRSLRSALPQGSEHSSPYAMEANLTSAALGDSCRGKAVA
jgi:hypothetical protein